MNISSNQFNIKPKIDWIWSI